MKKLLVVLSTSLVLFACSHNETSSTTAEASAPVTSEASVAPAPVASTAVTTSVEASAPVVSVAK